MENYLDECYICGYQTSSHSLGVPICNDSKCVKEWFDKTYVERVNVIFQYRQLEEDAE